MHWTLPALCLVVSLTALPELRAAREAQPEPLQADATVDWSDSIAPLLQTYCMDCHGGVKHSGGLDLHSLAGLARGAESGAVIVPGDPQASRLVQVLQADADLVMPPEDRDRPTTDQVQRIASWIADLPEDALQQWQADTAAPSESAGDDGHSEQGDRLPVGLDPELVIDLLLQSAWNEHQIQPAARCDDATFVRRIYLDLVGRIPTVDEGRQFLDDSHSEKREALIDRLLASREHATYLAEVFNVVLMERKGGRAAKRREDRGWNAFLEQAFYENRPWDQIARTILLARPQSDADQGAVWYLYERDDDHQEIAEAVASGFLGIRIECAQCHDHPLWSDLKQEHYWGMVAFFSRGENENTSHGPAVVESAIGGFREFTDLQGVSHRTQLVFLEAPLVDEPWPEGEQQDTDDLYRAGDGDVRIPKFSRREALVDRVILPHPRFARAMVNRVWALLMGRGLVHPVDQMDKLHPSSHPRLLDWLAEDFRSSGHDVRRLVRGIVRSRAYQLDSYPAAPGVGPENFASGLEKPLTAEAMLRSVLVALRQEPQPDSTELLDTFRKAFPDVLPETVDASVQQGLLLSNNPPFQQLLVEGLAADLAKMPDVDGRIDRAFQAVFCRAPAPQERSAVRQYLATRADETEQAMAQVVWALIASAEFRFNH